jgi:hypothetical protein
MFKLTNQFRIVMFVNWHVLFIHNTLDVMHYGKNLCEDVMNTIFGTKETTTFWEDLKDCGYKKLQLVGS